MGLSSSTVQGALVGEHFAMMASNNGGKLVRVGAAAEHGSYRRRESLIARLLTIPGFMDAEPWG